MKYIYVVTFKESGKKLYYTSINALYTAHRRDYLGVSKSRIGRVIPQKFRYENRFVVIEKLSAYNKSDVLKGEDKKQ
ncbi:MAG: hypothetical protein LUE93_11775 [Bacteroides sp.]|nr:hypothetical protein [Bacteroides sp.]